MPHDAHTSAHTLIQSISAVVLIVAGSVVLGLMARRRRLGLNTSVVRSNASVARTAASIAVVPLVGVAFLALLIALVANAQPGVPMAAS